MKCVRCGIDNTLKDRTGNYGACKSCHHPFVFEPTQMGTTKITDPMFVKIIADLSVNNTLFFTPKQLLYFLDGRLRRKNAVGTKAAWIASYGILNFILILIFSNAFPFAGSDTFFWVGLIISAFFVFAIFRTSKSEKLTTKIRRNASESLSILGAIVLILGVGASIFLESFFQFTLSISLGLFAIYLGFRQADRQQEFTQKLIIQFEQLQDWLHRWQQINGSVVQLLPSPREQLAPVEVNPEVSAYSFDHLVVCEKATIAQLLIKNNFHFEHNCAILSITGYPENIFETTLEMVRRNPDLKVYVFHDCSAQGIRVVHQVKHSPQWFQNSDVAIVDVGLSPQQVIASKGGLFVQRSPEAAQQAKPQLAELRSSLLAADLDWLEAGNFVELESFTPQKLMQVLHRSISDTRELDSESGSDLFFVGDSGGYFYTSESFG
ncbi:MAG: hypothetical protein HC852_24460 [Acaryochloridaceae cyanobacterium RU_4_10]|nr:hypothetical protein [Acaryochloridaceae cyanobacterium RU_4_10]